jgi:predicted nucleotidyltransferase
MNAPGGSLPVADIRTTKAVDEALIDEIVRRVLSVASPDRIILFGSAAAGQMTGDSDVDLLIVEQEPKDERRESVRIGDALRGLGVPFDVIVIGKEWFEASKNVVGGIAYPAHKYGKAIYAAS